MKLMRVSILLVVWLFSLITGCIETSAPVVDNVSRPPRLKITDLEPIDQVPLEVQCVFSVVLYRLPLKNLPSIPTVLPMLSAKGLHFKDSDGFSANHLWAASGTYFLGPEVISALGRLEAERTGIRKFILFQDYPEEIAGFPIEMGQSIFYLRGDGSLVGKQVPSGRLSLVLRAQPDIPRRGFSLVEIEPLFQPSTLRNLSMHHRESLFQSISFQEGRFETTMAEGDFIILTATRIQPDSGMFSRFFSDPDDNEAWALLYLILCQQAGSV